MGGDGNEAKAIVQAKEQVQFCQTLSQEVVVELDLSPIKKTLADLEHYHEGQLHSLHHTKETQQLKEEMDRE